MFICVQNFNLLNFTVQFPGLYPVPELFEKVGETLGINFHQVSSTSELHGRTSDRTTEHVSHKQTQRLLTRERKLVPKGYIPDSYQRYQNM